VTAGNEISDLARLVEPGVEHYGAKDVVRYLRGSGNGSLPG